MKKRHYLYLLFAIFSPFVELNASIFEIKNIFLFESGFFEIIKNNERGLNKFFYLSFFLGLSLLFLNNLILYFYLKSRSYLIYLGVIIFWILSGFFWFSDSNTSLSKLLFSLSIIIASTFYFYFIKDLFDLKEKKTNLNNLSNYFIISLFSILIISPFLTKYTIHMLYLCIIFISIFISLILLNNKKNDNLKVLIHSFSFLVIGLFSSFFFGVEFIFGGMTIHLLILGVAPLNKIKIRMDKELKEEKELSNLLEDVRYGLEKSIEKRTKEVKDLLDHMNSAVFAIGRNFKVLYPVSEKSKVVFGYDITGYNIYDFLFYNIRKGTKVFSDLSSCLTMVFDQDEIQFYALSGGLPKKVNLPSKDKKGIMTLKLSYSPILNKNKLVDKVLCIVEDVSDTEGYYIKSSDSVLNFEFLKEVANIENKKELAKGLQNATDKAFIVLEDFISPLSDTYKAKYFEEKLINYITEVKEDLKELHLLTDIFKKRCWEIIDIEERNVKIDPQIEATNIICDILDTLFQYKSTASLFFKVKFKANFKSVDFIMEKIKNLETQFNNLFEYVFLVRDIKNINQEKIEKVLHLAKLYPDFERAIDLIQQRSRLIFFLLKGVGEDKIAQYYIQLSNLVKLMPEKDKLDESIIKHNLIEPYKIILEKKNKIEDRVAKVGVSIEKHLIISNREYFNSILKLFKLLLDKNENKLNNNPNKLPELDPTSFDFVKSIVISLSPLQINHDVPNREFENIISTLESLIEEIFYNDLKTGDALPVEKDNIQFIKFIQNIVPFAFSDKK